ncbi:MAG: hypothetical protein MJ211_16025 [Bacteroidales bacterium]|nr:hypothetical protein [Bacteroidales bacterium]
MASYTIAVDINGEFVGIEESKHGTKYYCPACEDQLEPHKGDTYEHHFHHKHNECPFAEYFQFEAKYKFVEWYNKTDVKLQIKTKSIVKECKVDCVKYNSCKKNIEEQCVYDTINIKELFPKVELYYDKENHFAKIVDNKDNPQFYIEFVKYHDKANIKAKEGLKVVLINVKTIEELESLISGDSISGDLLKMYNFNKIEEQNIPCPDYLSKQIIIDKLNQLKEWYENNHEVWIKYNYITYYRCWQQETCANCIPECINGIVDKRSFNLKRSGKYKCELEKGKMSLSISDETPKNTIYIVLDRANNPSDGKVIIWIGNVDDVIKSNFIQEGDNIKYFNFKTENPKKKECSQEYVHK